MDTVNYQEGGNHYKSRIIQPIEYILANNLGFCEGNIVKYLTRYKDKGGIEDLKKARQYINFLIEDMMKKTQEQTGDYMNPGAVFSNYSKSDT